MSKMLYYQLREIKMKKMILAALLALLCSTAHAQVINTMSRLPRDSGAIVRPAAGYIGNVVLVANTNNAFTVPATASWVIMSFGCDVWVRKNAAAVIPLANVTDGTGSARNPNAWGLAGVTTLNFIAAAGCTGSLEFYQG